MLQRLLPIACFALALQAQDVVPVPKMNGPIPVTDKSHIFGEAKTNLTPLDLSKFGYVEEEFLISGSANVYDWQTDGSLTVKGANNPYTTRIVVRRPADPAKFSGTNSRQ